MTRKTRNKFKGGRSRQQTAKRMFIRGFIQSFFIVAILLTAGVLGYQMTMRLWKPEMKEMEITERPVPAPKPITEPSIDEVSRNLIFCYDSEKHIISKLILEVFHCEKKQLTYITIPMSTQFTMKDILYKKLIALQPSIPQLLRLSTMVRYLDSGVIFDYGVLLAEDMLGMDISYYTVIPVKLYQSIFEERSIPDRISLQELMSAEGITTKRGGGKSTAGTKASGAPEEITLTAEVFTKEFMKQANKLQDTMEIGSYMEELYQEVSSNLPLEGKLNYLESYSVTQAEEIRFTRIAGNERNSGFVLDEAKALQQLRELGVK